MDDTSCRQRKSKSKVLLVLAQFVAAEQPQLQPLGSSVGEEHLDMRNHCPTWWPCRGPEEGLNE